jgi:aspartate--ammonia ligase
MESHLYIPEGYKPALDLYDTQRAITFIKDAFQNQLSLNLDLKRVSAPLFLTQESGLNDNLNGYERPVSFDIPSVGTTAEVVHSLAKWKRWALGRYDFHVGKGLYTDMNAIRRDEVVDNIHSVYVDQWDWEKVITPETRTIEYLHLIVTAIVGSICNTNDLVRALYPQIKVKLNREVTFITSQELEDMYPELNPRQREHEFAREHKTIFVQGIGGKLKSGIPHDGRAPDYDDWDMNGDIIFWNDVLQDSFEVSSMGIRVSPESLARQLKLAGCEDRAKLPFHRMLLNNELPLTIGGGIGQSRLCMLLLGCAHIGEVHSSVWPEDMMKRCAEAGITLL